MPSIIHSRRTRVLAWCAAPVVATIVLGAAAPLLAPGVSFTMRTTTHAVGEQPGAPSINRVKVQGPVMRFDADPASTGESVGEGAYTLADMAGRRIVVVMPESKQYMEIKLDDSTATALTMAASSMAVVTDMSVDGQSLGSGGSVGGMSTRKYRLVTDYKYTSTSSSSSEGRGHMRVVEEYWVSDAMKDVMDPVEQIGRTLGSRSGMGTSPFSSLGATSLGDLMKKRYDAQRKLFTGMPVKTVTTTTDVDASGSKTESVTTTEVTDVQKGDMDPATFRVPEGYTKFDFKQFMNVGNQMKNAFKGLGQKKSADARAASGATDSTSILDAAKQGAKEGMKEGAKEGAKDATKDAAKDAAKKLGGLLKKRP